MGGQRLEGQHSDQGVQDLTQAALEAAVAQIGGTSREGQRTMAARVAQSLQAGEHLLVQAGTGTGKSLGYLVPAMVRSAKTGERVLVSTATLALQRQVLVKDAPLAAAAVEQVTGRQTQVALLKGWHNYVCLHRLAGGYPDQDEPDSLFSATAATTQRVGQGASASLGEQVVRLRQWAGQTPTGDRDDLVPGVSDRAWAQVSVSRAECVGPACPLRSQCFPERARATAAQADLVVTNHAMLGVAAAGNTNVLPDHEVLIVDEAHELADRLRSQATVSLSAGGVARVAASARRHAGVVVSDLEEASQALQLALAQVEDGRLSQGLPAALREALVLVDASARQVLADLRERAKDSAGSKDGQDVAGTALARTALTELVEAVARMTSDSVELRRDVAWCERPNRGQDPPRLVLAPIEVAGAAADVLLEGRAAVLTSATLELGGSFDPMARNLGLTLSSAPWQGLDVGTPFDYSRQAILYVPTHLPRPGRGVSPQALEEMVELAQASGGGMLGLFSSRQGAAEAAALLRERTDLPVLAQGEDQLPTLVKAFAAQDSACLVGSLSLWQGVDVPGPTCRLVVIDRIPFPRPDDPVAQARSEVVQAAGGNGFMSVSATQAALLLAQGAGRLVRRTDDRGVVAVLDPRLRTARYASYLLRSMPAMWPTTSRATVLESLERLGAMPRT